MVFAFVGPDKLRDHVFSCAQPLVEKVPTASSLTPDFAYSISFDIVSRTLNWRISVGRKCVPTPSSKAPINGPYAMATASSTDVLPCPLVATKTVIELSKSTSMWLKHRKSHRAIFFIRISSMGSPSILSVLASVMLDIVPIVENDHLLGVPLCGRAVSSRTSMSSLLASGFWFRSTS